MNVLEPRIAFIRACINPRGIPEGFRNVVQVVPGKRTRQNTAWATPSGLLVYGLAHCRTSAVGDRLDHALTGHEAGRKGLLKTPQLGRPHKLTADGRIVLNVDRAKAVVADHRTASPLPRMTMPLKAPPSLPKELGGRAVEAKRDMVLRGPPPKRAKADRAGRPCQAGRAGRTGRAHHPDRPGGARSAHSPRRTASAGRADAGRALRTLRAGRAGHARVRGRLHRARNAHRARRANRTGRAGRPQKGAPRKLREDQALRDGDGLHNPDGTLKRMGSWRDFVEWLKPGYVRRQEKVVQDLLDDNDALRKEVERLRKRNWRLEGQQEALTSALEAERSKVGLLAEQARRCKCRS